MENGYYVIGKGTGYNGKLELRLSEVPDCADDEVSTPCKDKADAEECIEYLLREWPAEYTLPTQEV